MLIARTSWLGRLFSLLWPVLLFLPMVLGGLMVGYWSGPRLLLFIGAIVLAMGGLRQVWRGRWSLATITLQGERMDLKCLGREETRNLGQLKKLNRKEGVGREILCLEWQDGVIWRMDSWMSQYDAIEKKLSERFPEKDEPLPD